MRFTLAALATSKPVYDSSPATLTVEIRPSRAAFGEHMYTTDLRSLMSMLKSTDLSGCVLDDFTQQLTSKATARIPSVELKDRFLREIGYFVD